MSARSGLYRAARLLGTVQAAERGPGTLAKRTARRAVYRKVNGTHGPLATEDRVVMKTARWPRALRSVVETTTYRSKANVAVHLMAAYGAFCDDCGWKGPLRENEESAADDRHAHITGGCWSGE